MNCFQGYDSRRGWVGERGVILTMSESFSERERERLRCTGELRDPLAGLFFAFGDLGSQPNWRFCNQGMIRDSMRFFSEPRRLPAVWKDPRFPC